MAPAPEVAVVVGAYSRPTYVLDAVRSVLDQTLERARVELLVTKNFRHGEIDAALARAGATVRFDDTPRIGPWLLAAIRATHAPIVTLLDDDDRYAPDRLGRVVDVFRTHPDVGFYRNRVAMVGPDDAPVPVGAWPPRGSDAYFDASGPVLLGPNAKADPVDLLFRRTRVSFNSSTMAFRRELLDGRRGEWFAATRLPDSSLLLNAVLSPYDLYLDDRRLTRHRLHATNVTRRTGWLRWAEESYRDFGEEAREFSRPDLAAYFAGNAVHFERLARSGELVDRVGEGAGRREIAGRASDYARFLARHAAERAWTADVWAAEAYAAAYLLSPRLARRFQRTRATRREAGGPVPSD
ncbi:MAG: glycosyltransferase family 2 protein [Thermoplasmata archaeon]